MARYPMVFVDVDTQADFLLPGGRLYVPGAEGLLATLTRLRDFAEQHDIPVLASTDAHPTDAREFEEWPPRKASGMASSLGALRMRCERQLWNRMLILLLFSGTTGFAQAVSAPVGPRDAEARGRRNGNLRQPFSVFSVLSVPSVLSTEHFRTVLWGIWIDSTIFRVGAAQPPKQGQASRHFLLRAGRPVPSEVEGNACPSCGLYSNAENGPGILDRDRNFPLLGSRAAGLAAKAKRIRPDKRRGSAQRFPAVVAGLSG